MITVRKSFFCVIKLCMYNLCSRKEPYKLYNLTNFITVMFTTLDQLQHHIHHNQSPQSRFGAFRREIKIVVGICITVFVVNSLVTNAQLYAEAVQNILQSSGFDNHTLHTDTSLS